MLLASSRLHEAIARVRPVDADWLDRAAARLDQLTKPRRSLGRLEWIGARLCAIQETLAPRSTPRRIVVFAADHGVAEEGVSAYPSVVTAQMVGNFLRGGAAINVLARAAGADVLVVDVGVAHPIDSIGDAAAFLPRRVRAGTRNLARAAAMSLDEVSSAINIGLDIADAAAADGVALLACGDMGIGNTTAASAMTAALVDVPACEVTGQGTGIDGEALVRKREVVERALRVNGFARPLADSSSVNDPGLRCGPDPLEVLRTVGGFEIAAMTGAYAGAAAHRIAFVGDGFISTAAILVASALCPAVLDCWFAGHQSSEPGHRVQLAHLRQRPLLDLDMRLGEGTGAALAMTVIGAAASAMNGMATFDSAGVADRQGSTRMADSR
jgi:nicotinate-nucleotide--dimethylbenzimidazole phosphoribosyltransferase